MKRSKITLEQITELENCKRAIKKASKSKRRRKNVQRILKNIDEYAVKLQSFLLNDPVFSMGVTKTLEADGSNKKKREICKPDFFPDQCAHWAIMLIAMPEIEKGFYQYSCASIKGRGTHYAKRATERMIRNEKASKYCLQMDIKAFYASIDKTILIETLRAKFKDPRIILLFKKIIYAYCRPGLPLGWYTSATLANLYLTKLDLYIKHSSGLGQRRMVRYMDDILVLGGNKKVLHHARHKIQIFLQRKLRLSLKKNWQVYRTPHYPRIKSPNYKEHRRAINFVGYRFYRYKRTIRKTIFLRMMRLFRKLAKGKYTKKNSFSFIAYFGYLKHTDSWNICSRFVNGIIHVKKIKTCK